MERLSPLLVFFILIILLHDEYLPTKVLLLFLNIVYTKSYHFMQFLRNEKNPRTI